MDAYIDVMNEYLSDHEPQFVRCNMESLLDMLYCCYQRRSGVDSPQIQAHLSKLDKILDILPLKQSDQVIDLALKLCCTYQWEAFREGILVGFRLYNELHNQVR